MTQAANPAAGSGPSSSDGANRFDRLSWVFLPLASVIAVVVILRLNRGTTFYFDELIWFSDLSRLGGLDAILHPHNSHLIGTTRTVYLLTASVFGPDYLVFRLLGVASVVLCAFLFFALAKRRVGATVALVPSILLLFYGSAWQHVAGPIGFTVLLSAAGGLAALLAIERDDKRGDIWACLFLVFAIFTYTVGLPFLVGIAILVLLRPNRLRRMWIFLVPLALYAGWWLWASQFDQGREQLSNAGRVGTFFAESTANIVGAITGVNGVLDGRPNALGWILAALFVAALIWRISRGNVPTSLWASLGILLTYWLAAALADEGSVQGAAEPAAVRLVYPATIGLLLVATDAARGLRPSRAGVGVVVAVGAFSLVMNVSLLRDGAEFLRGFGAAERVDLTMLELANGQLPGGSGGDAPRGTRDVLADDIGYLPLRP